MFPKNDWDSFKLALKRYNRCKKKLSSGANIIPSVALTSFPCCDESCFHRRIVNRVTGTSFARNLFHGCKIHANLLEPNYIACSLVKDLAQDLTLLSRRCNLDQLKRAELKCQESH